MRKIFIILIFLASCQNRSKTDAEYLLDRIQKGTDSTFNKQFDKKGRLLFSSANYNGSVYRTIVTYDRDILSSIRGRFLDALYGHYFDFFENGNLKMYCYYFGDNSKCSYVREYSKDGIQMNEKGNPFVDYIPVNNDSIYLFFSNVFADSINVEFSFGKLKKGIMILKKSIMQPLLLESKLYKSDSVLYIKINSVERKDKQRKIYYDTLIIRE